MGEVAIDLAHNLRRRFFDARPQLDAVLTFDPDHIGYFSGYRSMSSDMGRHYRMAALIDRDACHLVLSSADSPPALEKLGRPDRLFRYGEFHVVERAGGLLRQCRPAYDDFAAAVAAMVDTVLSRSGHLGLDLTGTAWSGFDFAAIFPSLTREVVTTEVERLRRCKLDAEIELISGAVRACEAGISEAFAMARPGVSERDVAAAVARAITAQGGVPRSLAVTSGPRSALVDAFSSPRILCSGEVLRIDLGATFEGYWADMARTAFIGAPDALQLDRFTALSAGLDAAKAAIIPGARASSIFERALEATRVAGLEGYRRHHCGHGVGVTINEFPVLNATNAAPLERGMVLAIETPFYEEGWGGMMTEDVVVVTDDGYRSLTSLPGGVRICGGSNSAAL